MNNLTRFAVSSLFISLVGCGDNGQPDPASANPDPGAMNPDPQAMKYPASCMDAGNGAQVADGDYTLYVGGDATKPWKAYCHGGDEFLSVNDYTNYGEYTAGGHAIGTTVRTTYTKLRIDPATLMVDISDQTFARSEGTLDRGTEHITSMPLGVAMACAWSLTYGTANIDLLGTPFKIVSSYALGSTNVGAALPTGSAAFFRENQWAEAWAYGECGFNGPTSLSGTPINQLADGWQLKLEWFVPAQP